jgi:hypothetical protein
VPAVDGVAAERATGTARHHAGIEGLAADRATGNGPGAAAARHVEGRVGGIEGVAAIAAEAVASGGRLMPASLAPRPVVRRIGIDEGACGWQDYPW